MEHEVFVPVPVPSLQRTLGDSARVARCVPGLQRDADASAGPLSGRLKVRIGGHTITYRGTLTPAPLPDGAGISVEGDGVEARGSGSAKLALTIRLTETDGGTTIGFTGTAGGEGRIVELEPEAMLAAAHRLLDRFAQQLVTESLATHGAAVDEATEAAVEQAIEEAAEQADETGAGASPVAEPTGDDDSGTPPAPVRSSTLLSPAVARRGRGHGVHRSRRTARRGRARPADHDRAQRRGGRPRAAAWAVRPRAVARLDHHGRHPALGGPRGRPRPRLRGRGEPGAAAPEVGAASSVVM